jgi:hypothetical protein
VSNIYEDIMAIARAEMLPVFQKQVQREVFDKFPDVRSVRWSQFMEYNDEYEYFGGGPDSSVTRYQVNGIPEEYFQGRYDYNKGKYSTVEGYDTERAACDVLKRVIDTIPRDALVLMFGDSVDVLLRRDGSFKAEDGEDGYDYAHTVHAHEYEIREVD